MPNIPEEIIDDIVSRLPVKSLMRFKCVCKRWFSLFSSLEFVKTHLKQIKEGKGSSSCYKILLANETLVYALDYGDANGDGNSVIKLNYPLRIGNSEFIDIVGTCDGLICLVADNNINAVVWNPSTRKSVKLAPPLIATEFLNFAGFGYDSSIDDYKVVRGVVTDLDSLEYDIQVLTLKSNKWKSIKLDKVPRIIGGPGILFEETLHWVTGEDGDYRVSSFKLEEERFIEIVPLPLGFNYRRALHSMDLRTDGRSLFLYCTIGFGSEAFYEVWEMKEYGVGESWTRLFCVSLDDLLPSTGRYRYRRLWLQFTRNHKLLLFEDANASDKIVAYDLHGKTTKILDRVRNPYGTQMREMVSYLESLVSPNQTHASAQMSSYSSKCYVSFDRIENN